MDKLYHRDRLKETEVKGGLWTILACPRVPESESEISLTRQRCLIQFFSRGTASQFTILARIPMARPRLKWWLMDRVRHSKRNPGFLVTAWNLTNRIDSLAWHDRRTFIYRETKTKMAKHEGKVISPGWPSHIVSQTFQNLPVQISLGPRPSPI